MKSILWLFLWWVGLVCPFVSFAESPSQSVPALVALTGDAASFGASERNGYQLAVEEWNAHGGLNGKQLKLKVEDTLSTTVGTISALQKFTALEGEKIVLGPTWGDTFQGVIPAAARSQVLLLSPAAEGKALDAKANSAPTMITTYPSTETEVGMLLDAVRRLGGRKLGLVSQQEPFAIFIRELLISGAAQRGLEVALDESVPGTQTDFRSILASAKRKAVDSLFLILFTDRSLLAALRQKAEMLPTVKLHGTHDFEGYATRSEFIPYLEGALFSTFEVRDRAFVERYTARFGEAPHLTASYAYDAANLLFRAYSLGLNDAASVRKYLLETEHETASFGKVRFLPEGRLTAAEIGLAVVREGKIRREPR